MASKIEVRVMKNGVVVHKHAGANGFHDPSRKHEGKASAVEGHKALNLTTAQLLKADGLDKLTPAQRAQHEAAINGKTAWIYPTKKVEVKVKTLEEDLAALDEIEASFAAMGV